MDKTQTIELLDSYLKSNNWDIKINIDDMNNLNIALTSMGDNIDSNDLIVNNDTNVEFSNEFYSYEDLQNVIDNDKIEFENSSVKRKMNDEDIIEMEKEKILLKKKTKKNGRNGNQSWNMDDVSTQNLSPDLDNSLNGLMNNSFNMSESNLLSNMTVQSMPVFKQEVPSPPMLVNNQSINQSQMRTNNKLFNRQQQMMLNQNGGEQMTKIAFDKIQNGVSQNGIVKNSDCDNSDDKKSMNAHQYYQNGSMNSNIDENLFDNGFQVQNGGSPNLVSSSTNNNVQPNNNTNERFQYVLGAATSIATKANEDTLTYLNQGQSYEIKLKKLGDLSSFKGKKLRSIIGICFYERRLQYSEKERLIQWQNMHPGDKVLEVDVPLSYGINSLEQLSLNAVCFEWDPTGPVGVYIKVNCISTEFTLKKHGGEKGVPFRIQIETFILDNNEETSLFANGQLKNDNSPTTTSNSFNKNGNVTSSGDACVPMNGQRLHAAACQIKVFKLKGADRKHKQDREKIMRRPISEQEKYQPSYECTILNDITPDNIYPSLISSIEINNKNISNNGTSNLVNTENLIQTNNFIKGEDSNQSTSSSGQLNYNSSDIISKATPIQNVNSLSPTANSEETLAWLQQNRFTDHYLQTFNNFSGADIMRLSRDDLIQICGLADGIRLYNALHSKSILPKLTLYMRMETMFDNDQNILQNNDKGYFNAIYLVSYKSNELLSKIVTFLGLGNERVQNLFVIGPNSIQILINDDVIAHMRDESMFLIELQHLPRMNNRQLYNIVLKPITDD